MGIFNKLIRTTKHIYLKLSSCKRVIKLTFSYQKHVDITSHCFFQEIKLILQRINIKLSYYDAFMLFSFMSLRLLNFSFFLNCEIPSCFLENMNIDEWESKSFLTVWSINTFTRDLFQCLVIIFICRTDEKIVICCYESLPRSKTAL